MTGKIITNLFFVFLFNASHVFAASFYSEQRSLNGSSIELSGDLSFSYSKVIKATHTREVLEKGFIRVIIDRDSKESLMTIEQKTKKGFLYFSYRASSDGWGYIKASFRNYEDFYKNNFGTCGSSPMINNQSDVFALKNKIETDNFGPLIFDKTCREKLSEKEYLQLVKSTHTLLVGDQQELNILEEPMSLTCIKSSAKLTPLKTEFQTLRNKVAIINKEITDPAEVKKISNLPFPISCDFDGSKQKKCGTLKEGLKSQISFDVSCLKKDPKNFTANAQGILMHEFMHTIHQPKVFTEEAVAKVDRGYCDFQKYVFASKGEIEISKQKLNKALNSEQSGHEFISKDVINPYAAFKPPDEGPTDTASSVTSNSTSNSMSTSTRALRSVASSNNVEANTAIPSLGYVPLPEPHYQAVKKYVDTSVATISKKIAPVVAYIESPAFAVEPQKPAVTNANEIAPPARAPAGHSEKDVPSNETASSSAIGSNTLPNSGISSGKAPQISAKAAVTKSLPPSRSTDQSLDNAYALNVRKRLLTDEKYRTQLRNDGVNIKFGDGYKFESSEKNIQYIEKNGVLKRGEIK
jgi:hypothetical protein